MRLSFNNLLVLCYFFFGLFDTITAQHSWHTSDQPNFIVSAIRIALAHVLSRTMALA